MVIIVIALARARPTCVLTFTGSRITDFEINSGSGRGGVMWIFESIRKTWGNGNYSPEFMRAQYETLTRQVPLMYAILIINMATPSLMYYDRAPLWLSVILPAILSTIFAARALRMLLARKRQISHREIVIQLRVILLLTAVLGIAATAWAMALFPYGDAQGKGQLTFFAGVTIITVITCLMPLRQIAAIIFCVVALPMVAFLAMQPETAYKAISFNVLVIVGGVVFVLRNSHAEFRQRVEKQVELDIQKQKLERLNTTITLLANEDSLTKLPNRRLFFERLDEMTGDEISTIGGFAVGLIDLDGFKPINDVLGHRAGDKLLTEVGRRFKNVAPDSALIARLGGDEFGFILTNPGNDDDLLAKCQNIVAALEPGFSFDEGTVTISGTCGVARYPDAGRSGIDLFERADFALYHSKQNDRGAVTIFSSFHESAIKEAATVGQRLLEADFEKELHLEYQPIIDAKTGAVLGLEALARWQNTILGNVRPDVFIRTAEHNGTIGKITMMLFAKVLKDAEQLPDNLYVSFNLSAHDLCSNSIMLAIFSMIGKSRISPNRLVFEITESSVMQDFDRALASLRSLRAAGFAVALDDFGTGYSSLSYVRKLPIDRIKVDCAFVHGIEHDKVGYNLLKTITEMCWNLDLQCIVEGVETTAQLEILSTTCCTAYQGYLFARPMKPTAFTGWLEVYELMRKPA